MKNEIIKRLNLNNLLYDALICLNSPLPTINIFKKLGKIPILAADGAALLMVKLGIEPDFIIGDLDSIKKSKKLNSFNSDKLIYEPEQDSNDFEKTLKFAISKNYKKILIFGFHGGLLEHTLNNWSVLMRYSHIVNLCIYENKRYCIPIHNSIEINLKSNELVSLIPQPEAILTTDNLHWKLDNELLKLGEREGARNRVDSDKIKIILHEGEYLLVIDARLPFCPQYYH